VSAPTPVAAEGRVLILAPIGRDAALTRQVLDRAGLVNDRCGDIAELCREAEIGAGCLLVAEEAITPSARRTLLEMLARQPGWSDLPVLVLTRHGADSAVASAAVEQLGNVTLLERPVRLATLLSACRVALRARERQYQIRAHLRREAADKLALQNADRRKDEFLATLAHELRNPLAPVRNSLHILRLAGAEDATVARVRAVMERQVDHLVRLVDDLMEVSRITRGKIELRRERTDLARVLRTAIETSQPLLDAAGHELAVELPPGPLPLDADPVRLAQVFSNLFNNAAKYAERPGHIHVRATREDGQVAVSVRDEGIGIEPGMLAHVFEMFTQVDGTHRRSQGGLGIGLTLVRSLVQLHGGTVAAHSDGIGRGSEFTVRLPLATAALAQVPAREQAPAPPVPLRVLVVDDNRDAADSLGVLLGFLGYSVEVAHDGAAALRVVERFHPALVLLDLGMPEMDGYEVARRLRAQPRWRDLVLVALTGWGQEEDRQRSREAGFDHHLVKPTDLDALQQLFTSVAERMRSVAVAGGATHAAGTARPH
jgi:signal transduction histidine kinase/ActR/RegA family two-component response regulator